jgi:hypothetical protein
MTAPDDPREHYAVKVTDLPPTEVVCTCGRSFTGDDPIAALTAHMDELNGEPGPGLADEPAAAP